MNLRDWMTRGVMIKLASVLLAVLVWTIVQKETTTTRVFHAVPYRLEVSDDMGITRQDFKSLRVTLMGPQDVMRDTTQDSIQVVHSLKGVQTPGNVHFFLSNEDLRISARAQVVDIHPRELNVALDRLVEKELAVKPRFVGKPETGFQVRDFVVSPTVVKVKGPQQMLQKLTQIETQPILLSGRTRSFVQTALLKPLLGPESGESQQHVEVYVKVEPELFRKTLESLRLDLLQSIRVETLQVRLVPPTVQVVVEGAREWVEKARAADLKVYVDVSDLTPGKYQIPVHALPASGLSVVRIEPDVVEVEVHGKLEAAS